MASAEADLKKLVRMRMLGEDVTYPWEYQRCLERVRARNRIQARQALRRSSSTKSSA